MDEVTLKKLQGNIKDAEKKLLEFREDINKAKAGGIDTADYEKSYQAKAKDIALLKSAYLK